MTLKIMASKCRNSKSRRESYENNYSSCINCALGIRSYISFAAMKINGNGTSKFEEDIEQKKYIDDMQSKSRYILHPEYLTAAMVYNIIRKFAVKQTEAKYVVHNNRKQLLYA